MAEEKLTAEEIKNKLLLATGDMGDTVLHMAAECGYVEVLQKLWEWAKERLTTEEVNNKLFTINHFGWTIWYWAADF